MPNSETTVMMATSTRASTGSTPQIRIFCRGQKYANPRKTPNVAPDAPMMKDGEKNVRAAPDSPLTKYSSRKWRLPRRLSSAGPKKYSPSMLKNRCQMPPWRNMYVMGVHGRTRISPGWNTRRFIAAGNACWSRKPSTFATISRVTQGVMAEG